MKLFIFFFASLSVSCLFAQTHTFTGNGGNTDWHTGANWSANSVPTNTSTVLIPDGFEVNIDATAVTQTLTLSGSGTLILAANLSVSETLSIETVAVLSYEQGSLTASTIENNGTIRFLNPQPKTIINTVINNNSRMDFIDSNIINLGGITTINNTENGVLDILANGGLIKENNATATLINDGLVKKYADNGDFGNFYMILNVINNNILEIVEDSQFLFLSPQASLHNTSTGILTGTGVFDITSPFLNEGTVSPGGDAIGELSFVNTFNLDNGILEIDIDSPEIFDTIVVTGAPDMEGTILLDVNYFPTDFDITTILTTQFTIDNCTFPNEIIYDTGDATFFVYETICNENSLDLELVDIFFIGVNEYNNLNYSISPNPIREEAIISLNYGKLASPQLNIYTISGKKVKTIYINSYSTTFNRDALVSGMYFVQLVSEGKIITTEKIILK